mmetsp:Transcript_10447/g.29525  ORF Transcript_10447/g.29525 Transcript_10447/m.29525 type:complete len:162 (+) Transcript_10447:403-888(+)
MAAAGRAAPRCTARAGRARGRPATRPSRRAAGTALACLPRRAALRRALPASADLTQRAVGPTEQGVIYVVDSADRDRFQDARNELRVILVDGQIKGVPVVLFANKQDGDGAASLDDVRAAVLPDQDRRASDRPIGVFGGSALRGDGLFDALDWLSARMKPV